MFRYLICFLLCFSQFLAASTISLKQQFAQAEPGSYLVMEQNKTFTFLYIRQCNSSSVVIEEVSIPAVRFNQCRMDWKDWFACSSPGNTSWIMSQIDLTTGKIVKSFSFTQGGWIDLSHDNPFIGTLLNLSFQEVPENERRKVGLPPGYGKPDYRPLWTPPLVFEGSRISGVPFSAWKARWPSDGSELARKWIEVYFPENHEGAAYLLYFPYWLEVEGKIGSAKLRVVDSGKNALSPREDLTLL